MCVTVTPDTRRARMHRERENTRTAPTRSTPGLKCDSRRREHSTGGWPLVTPWPWPPCWPPCRCGAAAAPPSRGRSPPPRTCRLLRRLVGRLVSSSTSSDLQGQQYVGTTAARTSASWLSEGFCQRQSTPEAAPGSGQPRLHGRLGGSGLGWLWPWAALAGPTSVVLSAHVADIPSHFGLASKYFTSSW